jgi:hypothetical protein
MVLLVIPNTMPKFLKPGGKLISLSHHYQLKPSQSDRTFFAWLKEHNARFLNCGRAFAWGDRFSNVPLQIIIIDKRMAKLARAHGEKSSLL